MGKTVRSVAGEFLLIVVGVLAALGVEEVWRGSEDRRRESEYVAELLAEARTNLGGVRDLEVEGAATHEGAGGGG